MAAFDLERGEGGSRTSLIAETRGASSRSDKTRSSTGAPVIRSAFEKDRSFNITPNLVPKELYLNNWARIARQSPAHRNEFIRELLPLCAGSLESWNPTVKESLLAALQIPPALHNRLSIFWRGSDEAHRELIFGLSGDNVPYIGVVARIPARESAGEQNLTLNNLPDRERARLGLYSFVEARGDTILWWNEATPKTQREFSELLALHLGLNAAEGRLDASVQIVGGLHLVVRGSNIDEAGVYSNGWKLTMTRTTQGGTSSEELSTVIFRTAMGMLRVGPIAPYDYSSMQYV